MKKKTTHIVILLSGILSPLTLSADNCFSGDIEKLASELSREWVNKSLHALDKYAPYGDSIRAEIEHSIVEGEDASFEARTLKEIDKWLMGQEDEGYPARILAPLVACEDGLCLFNLEGIVLHNQRYMDKFTYTESNNCIHIKMIHIYDGD